MPEVSPGLILILGALPLAFLRGRGRMAWQLLLPILSLLYVLHLGGVAAELPLEAAGRFGPLSLLGYELTPLRVDRLSLIFAYAFHVALFAGVLFALHVEDRLQAVSVFVYAGAAIGATFAGDLLTLFVYWEVVALASVFLIWAARTPLAFSAGQRYLLMQILSGLLLLAGVLVHLSHGHGLAFEAMDLVRPADDGGASLLILLAFGIKVGFPFLHTWIVDGYPAATPTGTVFLSAFTTKLAVYALARGFPGVEALVWVGTAMVVFPIFYAAVENDLRRVLCYSLINQLGYMVVAVGVGTPMALNGAAAQVFAHIIFKSLLFMSMGAVLYRTGTAKASELGGLWKTMPWTTVLCLIGAASISAFPLFSAFATKSLIMDSVADSHRTVVWLLLLFGAAGVLHHAGIKIPYCAFFAHDSGRRPKEAPWNMRAGMILAAVVCVGVGLAPGALYRLLPYPELAAEYQPYTASHVVMQLQLLVFALLAFVVLMRSGIHPHEQLSIFLDADWFTRRPVARAWHGALRVLARLATGFQALVLEELPRVATAMVMGYAPRRRGPLQGLWVMGSSIFVVLLLLFVYLVLFYLRPRG